MVKVYTNKVSIFSYNVSLDEYLQKVNKNRPGFICRIAKTNENLIEKKKFLSHC